MRTSEKYLHFSVTFCPGKSCLHLSFYYKAFVFLVELYLSTFRTNEGNLPVMHTFLVSTQPVSEKWSEKTTSPVILGSGLLCYSLIFYSQDIILVFWAEIFNWKRRAFFFWWCNSEKDKSIVGRKNKWKGEQNSHLSEVLSTCNSVDLRLLGIAFKWGGSWWGRAAEPVTQFLPPLRTVAMIGVWN